QILKRRAKLRQLLNAQLYPADVPVLVHQTQAVTPLGRGLGLAGEWLPNQFSQLLVLRCPENRGFLPCQFLVFIATKNTQGRIHRQNTSLIIKQNRTGGRKSPEALVQKR